VNLSNSGALRGRLRKYVGREGIHGIGIRMRADQPVVYVYVEGKQPSQERVFQELAAEAKPYEVEVVTEKVPVAAHKRVSVRQPPATRS
jgi:hypothetical protein